MNNVWSFVILYGVLGVLCNLVFVYLCVRKMRYIIGEDILVGFLLFITAPFIGGFVLFGYFFEKYKDITVWERKTDDESI